ncbi:MAG: alpha/beta hydrolase [Phycisphaerales bacterium]
MRRPLAQLVHAAALFTMLVAAAGLAAQASASPGGAIDQLRDWLAMPAAARPDLASQSFATMPLTRDEADEATRQWWENHAAQVRTSRQTEWAGKSITIGDRTMKFEVRTFGDKPASGRSLFISMHGGGNAAARVNDSQWRNQIDLYKPAEGLYIAPRAPTNSWNLWHEGPMDALLDRLIEDSVVFGGVNPDRVYLMGYSAGGDGVYQLGPRMADRWAAAAMMAGHPNDASPLNLRNVPFAIHVGEKDSGFGRNDIARKWGDQLDSLRKDDPEGYEHVVELHAGRGHWMNLEDATALPWMAGHTRNPWPRRVVWRQSGGQSRLYWLAAPLEQRKAGAMVVASIKGQEIVIERAEGVTSLEILLSDRILDMDQPIKVTSAGRTLFEGRASRTARAIAASLDRRPDTHMCYSAVVALRLGPPAPDK